MKKNEKSNGILRGKIKTLIFLSVTVLFLTALPLHAQQVENGNFETGDFTGWSVSGPEFHSADVVQHEGSWSGHIDINTGDASNSGTPNENWQMVGQTIMIPEAVDSLEFDMSLTAVYLFGRWHDGGSVWIMDADSVGTYTRLFYTGSGGGNTTNYPWEFHQVNIEAWAGHEATIYFAGHNYNGYADHQCDIYFDNVIFSDTDAPTVIVDAPNGGETLMVGETYQIEWTAEDDLGICSSEIYYSTYNGTNWTLIESLAGNPQTYDWIIPNTTSSNCLIKVVAYDAGDNFGEDVSDAVFTIASDVSPPTVEITSPNGGENWEVFEWHQVTWIADDDIDVVGDSVFYSVNNGADWTLLESHTGNPQNYYWSVPNTPSNECLLKVVVYDLSGNITEDISDGTFIISYDEPAQPDYAVVVKLSTYDDPDWQAVADALLDKYQGQLFIWNDSPNEVLNDVADFEPTHIGFVCETTTTNPNFIQNTIWPFTRDLDNDVYCDAIWGIITGYNAEDALDNVTGPLGFDIRTVLSGTDACDLEYYPQGVRTYEEEYNRYDVKYSDSNEIEEFTDGPTDRTEWLVTMLNEGIDILNYNPVDIFYTNGNGFHNNWQLHYPAPGQEGFFRSNDGQVYGETSTGSYINVNSDNPKIYFGLGNSDIGQIYTNGSMAPSWIHTGGANQYTGYLIDEEADSYQHGATKAYFYKVARNNTWAESFLLGNVALQYDLINETPGTNPPDLNGSVLYGDPGMQTKMSQQGEFKAPLFTSELIINEGTERDTVTYRITMNREGNPGFTGKWGERHPAIILPLKANDIEIVETNAMDVMIEDNFALMYIWHQGQPSLAAGETREVVFTYNPYSDVEEQIIPETPKMVLHQNYPNPFNPETTISFSVTQTSPFVTLEIFNIKGQKVKQFSIDDGRSSIVWNGKDENNQPVSSGIYFYKLESGKYSETKKMILMK